MYKYNKDELKESLTLEQVADLVAEFGGEPQIRDGIIVSKTICHNPAGEGSYKLYYYLLRDSFNKGIIAFVNAFAPS